MDSERGYRRLVKNVAGTFTLLWEDDFAYEVGRPYELTFALEGGTLRGFVDGVPMFVVEDADVPAGRMGLYCWGNADARFSSVRVFPARSRVTGVVGNPADACANAAHISTPPSAANPVAARVVRA